MFRFRDLRNGTGLVPMIVMQKVVSFSTINIQLIKLFKFTKFVKSFYLVYQSCKGLYLQVIKFT